MALALDPIDGGSPAYNAGAGVRKIVAKGINQAGTDIGNVYSPLIKPTVDAVSGAMGAGADLVGNVGSAVGNAINTGAGAVMQAKQAGDNALAGVRDGINDFGRGVVGANSLNQNLQLGNLQGTPEAAKAITNSLLPASGNMGLVDPAIVNQVNNATLPMPTQGPGMIYKPKVVPLKAVGMGGASVPVDNAQTAQNPVSIAQNPLTAGNGAGNGNMQLAEIPPPEPGTPAPIAYSSDVNLKLPNTSDYLGKQYAPTAVSGIDPYQIETGVNMMNLAGGPFGMLPALMAAKAGVMPYGNQQAQAVQARKEGLQNNEQGMEQYKNDADSAYKMADFGLKQQANNNEMSTAIANYQRNLHLDDATIQNQQATQLLGLKRLGLDASKQDTDQITTQQKLVLERSKQRAVEGNNVQRNAIESAKAKRPVVKMQNTYENGFVTGQQPITVDPYTGKVIGKGESSDDMGNYAPVEEQ